MVFALIGNQNCGKTTLFNQLTGSNQHVGNFPGVTVEKKEGLIRRTHDTVVDLPGIYSLSPYTSEEIVTRDFLLNEHPDGIINIIDGTNIERNLYLTMQLIELSIPMVVAANMMDEVTASGGSVNFAELSAELGVTALPISASKNQGISQLIESAEKVAARKAAPLRLDFCSGGVHRAIHSMAHLVEDHAAAARIPLRFAATKLIEGDQPTIDALKLNTNELDILAHIQDEMVSALGTDREAALADMRYAYIENLVAKTVKKPLEMREQKRTLRIDGVLTHRVFAIPVFLAIMSLVFYLTFDVFGKILNSWMSSAIDWLTSATDGALTAFGLAAPMHSLIIDGVFAGVGSVMSFLPTIIVLFFFLSILEDSGYMARVAFVMDKLLRKIGLSGRSIVPMLIGFGCSVPAIMSARTLSGERDRRMTILLTPFMSCSAKLPIYAVFTTAFFPNYAALAMISLYLLGIIIAVICGFVMKKTVFRGEPVPFVMELPSYRLPSPKTIALHMWEKAKDFIRKAFTVIFLASIVIWILQYFDFRFNIVENSADSMLAAIGTFIAPVFAPLGFGNWEASTALLAGFTAKESVVSSLAVLTGAGDLSALPAMLGQLFTPVSAAAYLVFTLLYTPCIAAVTAVKRELGGKRYAAGMMLFQTCVAWLMSFAVFQIGSIFA